MSRGSPGGWAQMPRTVGDAAGSLVMWGTQQPGLLSELTQPLHVLCAREFSSFS